jgi:hypothetical protein
MSLMTWLEDNIFPRTEFILDTIISQYSIIYETAIQSYAWTREIAMNLLNGKDVV